MFWCASAVVVAFALVTGDLSYRDERGYVTIADAVLRGDGYELDGETTAYRPPAWPLLLAVFRLLGTPIELLVAVSVALLVASALLARRIATHIAGPSAGWLAAFLLLLYPLNVYTAATLYPQTLGMAALLGAIALSLVDPRAARPWHGAGVGLLAVVVLYSVPTLAFAALVAVLWALWRFRHQAVRFVVPAVLAGLLPVALWTARNAVAFDAFVPVSTATGVNLLLGNSAEATPTSGVTADIDSHRATADRAAMTESEESSFYTDAAFTWVGENPGEAAQLYLGKVVNYFAPYNEPASATGGGLMERLVSYLTFVPLVALALVRLALWRRFPPKPPELLLLTVFMTSAAFMALTFTRTRFRQPLDSTLIIEAAVCTALLAGMVLRDRRAGHHSRVPRPRRSGDEALGAASRRHQIGR
ncbi:hypothetical protein GCM10011589_18940 [Modestobacter marinus]|uniref:Glycosyltransferase RgtA/B/C/D-like domain-containing protein n=2 Tax=Modestobacter marinus TaxID=477641 RepID=A0ABQ2FX16_9ACTN|nr:hypothetical protein GCM10011589_18940 [Modestobacter marinus]